MAEAAASAPSPTNSLDALLPISDYRFDFPEELIATAPAEPRDSSRLMVVSRETGEIRHAYFRDLPDFLEPGDCVVLNRTKVRPCRLRGRKAGGGEKEILLVGEESTGLWRVLGTNLKPGVRIDFEDGLSGTVEVSSAEGSLCRFNRADLSGYLETHGLAPLPPYILKKRRTLTPHPSPLAPAVSDRERYQTVYARDAGSVAAPTAGLHFTDDLLARLEKQGVRTACLTLHVGLGTFKPIQTEDAVAHAMLPEHFEMDEAAASTVQAARTQGRRVTAVGTTTVRTLETLARRPQGFGAGAGFTNLYLHPGKRFELVTALITNFHLPESTPLLLACAFLGREKLLAAYQEAFRLKYRLYSYGDAMLIL